MAGEAVEVAAAGESRTSQVPPMEDFPPSMGLPGDGAPPGHVGEAERWWSGAEDGGRV